MERDNHCYAIEKSRWEDICRVYRCEAVKSKGEIIIARFTAVQARNYTCDHLCPLKNPCGLTKRAEQKERFVLGICVVSRGPRHDSLPFAKVD